ncbi:MAG TPA: histidinol dehydrogenase, partial [Thermotogaceae bacterium]|nr:histidinol dehydrogenase [Thermotogaceae bacterium]
MGGNSMKTLLFPSIEDINEILAKRIDDLSEIQMVVSEIVNSVRKNGDESLQKWINKFEKYPVPIKDLKVKEEEFMKIDIPNDFEKSLKGFIKRVENFHKIQLEESRFIFSENGSFLGFKIQPIKNVGIYVPSGKAPYFSSLVMCAVPAIIAGVERIAVVTPPDSNGNISPLILKTCSELGIDEVYKVGGAHSIAALAYGTETIVKVDKIVGPGNIYVALAKKMVFGDCGIDSVAGPSEIVIIADESSKTEH